MKRPLKYTYKIILGLLLLSTWEATAQNMQYVSMPFLNLTPDARSGGMGDVSSAIDPDGNAIFGNVSRLAFVKQDYGFAVSYNPWLQNLASDVNMSYLSLYKKINNDAVLATAFKYFSMGQADLTDANRNPLGTLSPKDLSLDLGLTKRFGGRFSLGATGRYVYSNLATGSPLNGQEVKSAYGFAIDFSTYYFRPVVFFSKNATWSLGAGISNFGTKISYFETGAKTFQPMNFKTGTALKFISEDPTLHYLTFAFELNKLLTPFTKANEISTTGAFFNSFSNLKGIGFSAGVEYFFQQTFALRTGYIRQNPESGGLTAMSYGVGVKYGVMAFDFGYIMPFSQSTAFANSLRFSVAFNFEMEEPSNEKN